MRAYIKDRVTSVKYKRGKNTKGRQPLIYRSERKQARRKGKEEIEKQ